jgi:hypothetical protein
MKRKDSDFKKLYDSLLASEDIKKLYGGLTLNWELDKDKFIRYQTELEQLINIMDVDNEE